MPLPASDDIVLEIKLPVAVKDLAAIAEALGKIHGKNVLFMRQVGQMLQLYKTERPAHNPKSSNNPNP